MISAVWHFPRWSTAGEFPFRTVRLSIIAMAGFSVVFTFLYNQSRGSVLPWLLLHGSANTFWVILPIERAWGAWTIVISVIASIIVLTDMRLGAGRGPLPD